MPSRSEVKIFSDFDDTMVPVNTAKLLIWHYLVRNPHHEPLRRRLGRAGLMASSYLRRRYLTSYYDCLRRIPSAERHRLLSKVHVSEHWLRAISGVRKRHRARSVRLVIVTRNCVSVVRDWVMQNRDVLRKHRIHVEGIIANGPLTDEDIRPVLARTGVEHADYLAFGQMMEREKRAFVGRDAIYIGDAEDELLRPFVRKFVRL